MKLPLSITSPTPMACAVASPRTTQPSISAAIGEIEQKISHHAQIIIDLKIERNSLLPISQLPVEVLCKIFRCTQQSYDTGEYSYSSHVPGIPRSWMAVTRVCHYWRNAALNEASLWTKPVLKHSTKWTSVFLERSRMAGVTLSFVNELFSTRLPKLLATVVPHIPHATTIVMQGMQRQAMDMVFKYLSSTPAPMLTTLVIDGTTAVQYAYTVPYLGADRYTSVPLPKNALAEASMLRHLSLSSIKISWNSHLLSGLTDLKLENISENARPTPQEFLLVLGQNLALRSLTLRHVLPTSKTLRLVDFPSNNRRRIPLRSLETLDIASEATACEFLTSHVALSGELKKINIDLPYGISQNGQAYGILAALDEADIRQLFSSSFRHVTMTGQIPDDSPSFRHAYSLTLQAIGSAKSFNSEDDIFPVSVINNGLLDLRVQASQAEHPGDPLAAHSSDIFSDLFQALQWDNLSDLDIQALKVYQPGFHVRLAATFGRLPGLRAVSVGELSVNCFLDALLLNWDKDPAVLLDSVSFPALQHIDFNDIEFETDSESVTEFAVEVDRLMDCLMNRCERSVPIHSISMKKCFVFGMPDRRLLEEVVVNVHCDGSAVFDHFPNDLASLNYPDDCDFDSDYYYDDTFA